MNTPTGRQAEFLAFIQDYTRLNRRPPSEAEMQRHFSVTPPSVHQMVLMLVSSSSVMFTAGLITN